MVTLEKVARRVPFLRYCILQHHRQERKRQADIRWEYRRTVYSSLGQTISTWAGVEMILDHLIQWYHPIAGESGIQPDLPVTFDRKMDYLNKMARDPQWTDGGAMLRDIRTECKRLNKMRKAMVHGVAWHLHPHSLDWAVQLREFSGPSSELKFYAFRLEDLSEILRQITALLGVVSPWVAGVIGLRAAKANANSSSASSG